MKKASPPDLAATAVKMALPPNRVVATAKIVKPPSSVVIIAKKANAPKHVMVTGRSPPHKKVGTVRARSNEMIGRSNEINGAMENPAPARGVFPGASSCKRASPVNWSFPRNLHALSSFFAAGFPRSVWGDPRAERSREIFPCLYGHNHLDSCSGLKRRNIPGSHVVFPGFRLLTTEIFSVVEASSLLTVLRIIPREKISGI